MPAEGGQGGTMVKGHEGRPREAPASWCPRFCGFEAQNSSNPCTFFCGFEGMKLLDLSTFLRI